MAPSLHGGNSQQQRIPAALQHVFLQSNRGNEVNVAPPNSVASKVYHENWNLQRSAASSTDDKAPQTKSQYWLQQKQKQKLATNTNDPSNNRTRPKRGTLRRIPSFAGVSFFRKCIFTMKGYYYCRDTSSTFRFILSKPLPFIAEITTRSFEPIIGSTWLSTDHLQGSPNGLPQYTHTTPGRFLRTSPRGMDSHTRHGPSPTHLTLDSRQRL